MNAREREHPQKFPALRGKACLIQFMKRRGLLTWVCRKGFGQQVPSPV